MDRESPFSDEYAPSGGTEAVKKEGDRGVENVTQELEEQYRLAKPMRRVIRASIIKDDN